MTEVGGIAGDHLKAYVERIERLNEIVAEKQVMQRAALVSFGISDRHHALARDKRGRLTANPFIRFFDYVEMDTDGCWIWIGSTVSSGGYGLFSYLGRYVLSHRWAYEQLRGKIPDGLQLDHLCRRPACVNPWHLEPVTQYENWRRGEGASVLSAHQKHLASKTHCPHGHPYSGDNLYIQPSNGARICRACARRRRSEYTLKNGAA